MVLSSTPLRPEHLPACEQLWLDRAAYTQSERRQFRSTLTNLLVSGRARGTFITSGTTVRACGASVFVSEAWADRYLQSPTPLMGWQLLCDAAAGGPAVLDRARIGVANAGTGLTLAVIGTGHDVTIARIAEIPLLLGAFIQAFLFMHRGYRVSRMLNEVFGDIGIRAVIESGVHARTRPMLSPGTAGEPLPSALFDVTRDEALASRTPMLPLFLYNEPRIGFTMAEQDLLSAALSGAPDDVLARDLGVALSTVKGRWTRIFERVTAREPSLLMAAALPPGMCRPAPARGRGAQTRHRIIQYVRDNPSELTPYDPRTGEGGRAVSGRRRSRDGRGPGHPPRSLNGS